MKRWVIIGANVYLGRELCCNLALHGQVLGFTRKEHEVFDLQDIGVQCHTYEDLPKVLDAGDIVVHCAGRTY